MVVKKSKVAVNIKKNRLTITVAERITKKTIDSLYTEIRFAVADLKPGFDVVTDLSACSLAALSSLPTFRKVTNHLVSAKVGRVVRVIDETKIIKKQLINIAARMQSYKVEIVSSLEAADEFLSKSDSNEGLSFGLQDQSINYVYGDQEGTAVVEYLSVHICEVQKASLPVDIDKKVSISIRFDSFEGLLEHFEATALITWVDGEKFGACFEGVDKELEEQLWERLVHESQSEMS